MSELCQLLNIGKVLEEKLMKIGINTFEELEKIGSQEAFMKIRAVDNTACYNMLCAIEGAIQRKRWFYLSEEDKNRLKEFYKMINIK